MKQEHLVLPISLSVNWKRTHTCPTFHSVQCRSQSRIWNVIRLLPIFFMTKMFYFFFLSTPHDQATLLSPPESRLMCLLFCAWTQVSSGSVRVGMFSWTNRRSRHSLRFLSHTDDIYTLTRSRPVEFKPPPSPLLTVACCLNMYVFHTTCFRMKQNYLPICCVLHLQLTYQAWMQYYTQTLQHTALRMNHLNNLITFYVRCCQVQVFSICTCEWKGAVPCYSLSPSFWLWTSCGVSLCFLGSSGFTWQETRVTLWRGTPNALQLHVSDKSALIHTSPVVVFLKCGKGASLIIQVISVSYVIYRVQYPWRMRPKKTDF